MTAVRPRVRAWCLRLGAVVVVTALSACTGGDPHAAQGEGGHGHGGHGGHGAHDGAARHGPHATVGDRADGAAVPTLRVGLTEWTVATARRQVRPGEVDLVVTNAGASEHDLVVRGRHGRWHSPHLAPGEQTRMTVQAAAGERLRLWCSLPGHDAQGMHTVVTVTR